MTKLCRHLFIGGMFLVIGLSATVHGYELSRQAQLELIGYYKLATEGINSIPSESKSLLDLDQAQFPIKCGTMITSSYVSNFKKFDKDLVASLGLSVTARPTETDESYDSPGGYFKIHFTRSGSHAVYQPTNTTGGIPNYVLGVARIFDSVYTHVHSQLGYPTPPQDGGYPSGIDNLYDVYLTNLGGSFFGLTYPDSLPFSGPAALDATSFIVIDNDYQEAGFGIYRSTPLDAVRVTAAHEYFHAVQFGIDFSETEVDTTAGYDRRYWYEMSAVWMEDEIYDNINDYYTVIPFFFDFPHSSIQQYSSPFDFHPYASVVFPKYLSEKFGVNIIRYIWLLCGQLGFGPDMLEATNIAVDSASGGADNFRSIFSEFTVWNYFTGSRAASAPPGIGYLDRANYPEIPESTFNTINQYPVNQDAFQNFSRPAVNGAEYFKLNNTRAIFYTDSADTQLRVSMAFGGVIADSALPQGWGVWRLGQLDANPDMYVDSSASYNDNANYFLRINNPRQYRSVIYVLAPASWKWPAYRSLDYDTRYGYIITDSLALTPGKSSLVLSPYPNPASVSQMNGSDLNFRFEVATDSVGSPVYISSYSQIDIYTTAGELIKTIETVSPPVIVDPVSGDAYFDVGWDMRNDGGKDAASGVYICLVRLYDTEKRANLLAEQTTKVLLVR